jgi:ribonuclease PH
MRSDGRGWDEIRPVTIVPDVVDYAEGSALIQVGKTEAIPSGVLQTGIAAISLGVVDGRLLLDLCYAEDSAATADFNVVMTGGSRLVEVQGTAEGAPFDRQTVEAVLDLAEKGIDRLLALQRQVLQAAVEAGE